MSNTLRGWKKAEMLSLIELQGVAGVRAEVLRARQQELGLSTYALAKLVVQIRNQYFGDNITDHRSIMTSVTDALKTPSKSQSKTVEAIIIAMGGVLKIDWEKEVTHIEIETKNFSENAFDSEDEPQSLDEDSEDGPEQRDEQDSERPILDDTEHDTDSQ